MNKIAVSVSVDEKFAVPFAVMLASMEDHLGSDSDVTVYAVHSRMRSQLKEKIKDSAPRIKIVWVEIDDAKLANLPVTYHFAPATYHSLAIDQIPRDRVIHLDIDTLVMTDIKDLWNIDIENKTIGAAPEMYVPSCDSNANLSSLFPFRAELGIVDPVKVFNSGVRIINLKSWRENAIGDRCIKFIADHAKDIKWVDQDGLNACLIGDWKEIPLDWNFQIGCLGLFQVAISGDEFNRLLTQRKIIHFTGPNKPWNAGYQGLFATEWNRYYQMTAFYKGEKAPILPAPIKGLVSVSTPANTTKYMKRAYESLKAQTYENWEWNILLNGAAVDDFLEIADPRVKIYREPCNGLIGAMKKISHGKSTGEIQVEFDMDDELTPDCLEEVVKAIGEGHDYVFSNSCHVENDFKPHMYSPYYGWRYRPFDWKGHTLMEAISPEISPTNLGRIWFAPDHVRAWTTEMYRAIGGHNADLEVADDHDLSIRMYLAGARIKHIDKCLYIYNIHGHNSICTKQEQINKCQWANYDKFIYPMLDKWCAQKNLLKVDLGGGLNRFQDYKSYDLRDGADIQADLNDDFKLEDDSVGVLRAHDMVEHLTDPIHFMNEAYRVLAPNGMLMILVPSALGEGGFCDPTHKSFWVPRSFRYYTEPGMRQYLPGCKCKFMVIKQESILMWEGLPYIRVDLLACKEGPQMHGGYNWGGTE